MIRLELTFPDTRLLSTLCAHCPHGPAGCCVSPPPFDWSDVGRVVARGGRDFLLAEIARGALVPFDGGLLIRRVRTRSSALEPRQNRCSFHGPSGCTIDDDRRPATCNYYLCEDAYSDGGRGPEVAEARAAHAGLMDAYPRWDADLTVKIRSTWPDGPPWDAAFLDWLGEELMRLTG